MDRDTDSRNNAGTVVVVPCYNEAKRFDSAAFDAFLTHSPGITLLLVDDGSIDDTPLIRERLRQRFPQRVLTLRLCTNVGKAEAVRRGMHLAIRRRAKYVGYWDADLATPLDTIPRFETILQTRPELMLIMGSRVALLGRQIRRRWRRHLLGRAFATAASLVLTLPVYDTQCGAKLFRVAPATIDLIRKPFRTRWIFDVEILARMVTQFRNESLLAAEDVIYEYPLESWHDVQGSRLQSMDFVTAALDLAGIYWRDMRARVRIPRETQQPTSSVQHLESNTQHRDAA